MRRLAAIATPLLGLALVLVFVAERIVGTGGVRTGLLVAAAVAALAALVWRTVEHGRAAGAVRAVEARLLLAYAGVAAGLGLYALSTEWGLELVGLSGEGAERVGGVLGALWPAVTTSAFVPLFFMELAYRTMPVAEAVELRRIRSAAQGGLGLALATVFLFSVNYVASERDVKRDLSYFKTTRPSEATLEMVRNLGEPLKIVLFYPRVNEVLDQARPYFEDLRRASTKISVEVMDHALAPELARQHRVRGNGFALLLRGSGDGQQAESVELGVELEAARARLRKLDGAFQKGFMKLTKARREVHLTTGHDERSAAGADGDDAGERTRDLLDIFQRSNVETKSLGMAQGLANRVPEGVPAVAVLGPRKPFLEEEALALLEYVKGGGRLVVMVDPDVDHGLGPLLSALGLTLRDGVVATATPRQFLRRSQTAADHANIVTKQYTSHPTVTVMTRNASRTGWASIFVGAGALEKVEGPGVLPGAQAVFPIRSASDFWLDADGNYEQDTAAEPSGTFSLMAAVTVPHAGGEEGRVVVVADGAFVTDQVIRNPGNVYVFADIMQWLIGEEQIVGDTASEEDVRIEHTSEDDRIWFYATSFGAPLPILGLGVWVALRRRRRSEGSRTRPASEANAP